MDEVTKESVLMIIAASFMGIIFGQMGTPTQFWLSVLCAVASVVFLVYFSAKEAHFDSWEEWLCEDYYNHSPEANELISVYYNGPDQLQPKKSVDLIDAS